MDIVSAQSRIAEGGSACERESMNVEIVAKNPLLSSDRKWAIRFSANGLTTIVLGMKDFGNPCLSAYFAQLVAARLGIPFGRIRLYYSATLPAVLRTPRLQSTLLSGSNLGSVAAAASVIEELCDQVIEKVRQIANADGEATFDRTGGRLYRNLDRKVFEKLQKTAPRSELQSRILPAMGRLSPCRLECLSSLGMTIPRMLNTALQRRFENPAMRMSYPLSRFVLEIGLDRSTRILSLETLDGFQVSFSLSEEQCREIGEAEPQEPENRLATQHLIDFLFGGSVL